MSEHLSGVILYRLIIKLFCLFLKCNSLLQYLKPNFCASRLVTCLFSLFSPRMERYSKYVTILPCKEVPNFIYKEENVVYDTVMQRNVFS